MRARVDAVRARLTQGLALVHSLVRAQVEQLSAFVAPLAALLREGAFGLGVTLVGETPFATYLVSVYVFAVWQKRDDELVTRTDIDAFGMLLGPTRQLSQVGRSGYPSEL